MFWLFYEAYPATSVELLQLLVCNKEDDVPRSHAKPGGYEAFVKRRKALVADRVDGTINASLIDFV